MNSKRFLILVGLVVFAMGFALQQRLPKSMVVHDYIFPANNTGADSVVGKMNVNIDAIVMTEKPDNGDTSKNKLADVYSLDSLCIKKIVSGQESCRLSSVDFSIDIPAGAVKSEKEITVKGLRHEDIHTLDASIINVTSNYVGYRCLPHGKFEKELRLSIGYDTLLIPEGYYPTDIRTFFYDEEKQLWEILPIDSIDFQECLIISRTDHFTDFINGILRQPEISETENYTPTSIRNLEYANPLEGMSIIEPPSANNSGNCSMNFPIIVPAGRNGMTPQISISYSSDVKDGIMGPGWSLNIPSITVDTRWGVPPYSPTVESESYLVNGEAIVEDTCVNSDNIERRKPLYATKGYDRNTTGAKKYAYLTEGKFDRIIRNGTSPNNYWWKVIDREGVQYIYGDSTGRPSEHHYSMSDSLNNYNIAVWGLAKSTDTYGNWIRYTYTDTVDNTYKSRQFRIDSIIYTNYGTEIGPYIIKFEYNAVTNSAPLSARYGFLTSNIRLLSKIKISYNNEFVKCYRFEYANGASSRKVLKVIAEIFDENMENAEIDCTNNANNAEKQGFYIHFFDYYDESLPAFESSNSLFIPDDGNINILGNNVILGRNISKNTSYSITAGGSTCIGANDGVPYLKDNSLGLNYHYTYSRNNQKSQFIDINGDGIVDRVEKTISNGVIYYKGERTYNDSHISFSSTSNPLGIPRLNKSASHTNSLGTELMLSAWGIRGMLGYSASWTKTINSDYFLDVNGDGFLDFVYNGNVLLNFPDEDDNPSFNSMGNNATQISYDPCYSFGYGGSAQVSNPNDESLRAKRDPVIIWESPLSCYYDVRFKTSLEDDPNIDGQNLIQGVTIIKPNKDTIYSKYKDCPHNFHFNGVYPYDYLYIPKGGFILFHTHSDNEYSVNRITDSITINAVVSTLPSYASELNSGTTDADGNHLLHFQYNEDVVIQDGNPFTAMQNGSVKLSASLSSQAMSDTLNYYLIYETFHSSDTSYTADTIRHHVFNSGQGISHNIIDSTINLSQYDRLSFRLEANSNVKWSSIAFTSNVKYIEGTTNYKDTITYHPSLGMSIYSKQLCLSQPIQLVAGNYTISPDLDVQNYIASNISTNDTAFLTVKTSNNLIAKKKIVANGQVVGGTLNFSLPDDQCVYFDYTVNGNINEDDSIYYSAIVTVATSLNSYVKPAGFYARYNDSLKVFGNLYRGWGQFSYRDSLLRVFESEDYAILFNNLSISTTSMTSDDMESISNNSAFRSLFSSNVTEDQLTNFVNSSPMVSLKFRNFEPLSADISTSKWIDPFNSAYISKEYMGSGYGTQTILQAIEENELAEADDDMPNFSNPLRIGGRFPVVNRVGRNISHSFSASLLGSLGFNVTKNKSFGYSDMIDMNGDGYPDIVTPTEIQYTLPNGDMSNNIFSFANDREVNTSYSEGKATGTSVSFKSSRLAEKTTNPNSIERNICTTAGLNNNTSTNDMFGSYIDINSDGLPDIVYYADSTNKTYVEYNLGYRFSPPFQINNIYKIASNTSQSNPWSSGVNVNFANYSFSGGINTNQNISGDNLTMIDINSDGFIDIVSVNNNTMTIYLNNGTQFSNSNNINNIGISNLSENQTFNISGNVSGSFGFLMTYVKITISLYADFSYNLSNEKLRLMDLNGDGAIDILSVGDNGATVRYGIPQKHNLLKKVITPALGEYEMYYSMLYSDIHNPNSKWIMTGLKIRDNDGGFNDGCDSLQYTFEYSDMKYHRIERESYGFAKVVTKTVDDCNSVSPNVLRKQKAYFHTENGLLHGLKYKEETLAADDNVQVKTDYNWTLNDLNTGQVVSNPECGGEFYPRLKSEKITVYGIDASNTQTSLKHYEYTKYGNISKYVNKYKHNDSVTAIMTYSPDRNRNILGRLIELTVKSKNNETIRKMGREYNDCGDITKVINYMSDNVLDTCATDFQYDGYGNLTKVTYPVNANGERSFYRYAYDDEIHTYLSEVKDTFGCTTQLQYYDYRFGKPRAVIAQNGTDTKFTYYSDGKVETVKAYNDLNYSARFVYWGILDTHHRTRWARVIHHDTINIGNTFVTQTVCDGLGRTIQTARKSVVEGATKYVISGKNVYDAYGRIVQTYQPQVSNNQYDAGSVYNGTFANPTAYTYDCIDRQLSATTPDGITVYKSYDISLDAFDDTAMLVTTTYPQGRILRSYTDPRGLQTTTKALRNAGDIVTKFKYSPMGELLVSTDPEGDSTTYDYDRLGRLIKRTHPDAGNTTFHYDKAGNLVSKETQKLQNANRCITYSYRFNRLMEIHYPHNPQMDVYYKYGESGLSKGLVTVRQDGVCVQNYSYNGMGDIVENIRTFAMPSGSLMTFATTWEYDTWGRTKSITYPDGETIDYRYDDAGKVTGMYSRNTAIVGRIEYDKYGNRTYIQYGNGTCNRYTYNAQNLQLSRLRSYDASNTLMQDISYTYDNLYNITALDDNVTNGHYTYAYDTLNRVISSTGTSTIGSNMPTYDFSISYSPAGRIQNYSLTGNKLEGGQLTAMNLVRNYYYANADQPHAPTSISPQSLLLGTSYSWDANGNFKGTSGRALFSTRTAYFDEENRLAAIGDWIRRPQMTQNGTVTKGTASTYLYDADGERVWKFAGTATTTYSNYQPLSSTLEMDKTFYPTPQTTFDKQTFYKHYYIGSERICTQTGKFTQPNPAPAAVGLIDGTTNVFIAGFNDMVANFLDSVGYSDNITIDTIFNSIGINNRPKTYYYHYNHQGSVSLVTYQNGTLQQRLQYLPYGGIFVDHRPGSYSSTYTFSAKEKDSESGYTYFGARYYSDGIMQWLSVDPMSDKYPSVSPYMYCAGNPIRLIDPNGEDILAYNDYSKRKMKSYFKQLFGNSKMFTFNNNRLEIRDKQFERAYNSSTLDQQKLLDGFNEAINRDEKVIVKVAKNVKGFAFYKYDNPDIPDEPTSLSTLPNMGGGATRWSNDFSSYIIGVDDAVKNNLTTNNPSVMTGTPAATFVHETLDEFLNYFSKGIINNNTPKINQVENHNTALRILKLPERNGEDHQ